MGIELDVLVGHPEHDLLFVASQVAAAAGLGNPKAAVHNNRQWRKSGVQLGTLVQLSDTSLPRDSQGRRLRITSVMFSESEVYTMLLSGKAPQSEPFRRWVTEEVLPIIRKTGKYDAEQSTNPIAVGIMDELKLLRGEFSRVAGELVELRAPLKPYR